MSLEKTFWGTTILTFLGFLLNTEDQIVSIPVEKVNKALEITEYFLNKSNKKATVKDIQRLCGFLNFLCRCVVPGRAFTRRLYSMVSSRMCQHHHVRITEEMKMDLEIWRIFLRNPSIYCRPFADFEVVTAKEINMYSDASRNFQKGFGALCGTSWSCGVWNARFMEQNQPSIEYLELYAVTVAVLNWIRRYSNKRVFLFCDNMSVVHMLNKSSSTCKNCMVLVRLIVLEGLLRNVRVYAKHVRTEHNILSDSLSRLNFDKFRKHGPHMEEMSTPIPDEIWPMEKIWLGSCTEVKY